MAGSVFVLCALTSLLCSVLLYRGYRKSHARLLFWSALCFLGLAVNNTLLYIDTQIIVDKDLSVIREIPALMGVCCLLYGLIAECSD